MTIDEIEAEVHNIIAENLGIKRADINNDSKLIEDLGADSLDIIEMVLQMEEVWDIEIPDSAWANEGGARTVQDIIDYVNKIKT